MSALQKFDTIVIGAGVAGLGAAALLAQDAGQRVLVLERAPFIGGRTLSYVGRGNKVVADGIEMDADAFRKVPAYAHCYLGKCTPSIEEIFDARPARRPHVRGRRARPVLGQPQPRRLPSCSISACTGICRSTAVSASSPGRAKASPDGPIRCEKGKPYPWMSEAGFDATMEQLAATWRARSFEDMARVDERRRCRPGSSSATCTPRPTTTSRCWPPRRPRRRSR